VFPRRRNAPSAVALLFIASVTAQDVIGLYYWTWDNSNPTPPAGCNLGVAFGGYSNPGTALSDASSVHNKLPGTKYLDLGGGDSSGNWDSGTLNNIITYINNNSFSAYQGICFDVEQGNAGLSSQFESAFKAAKAKGFRVLVTISHSAPYGFSDASTLMKEFFNSTNIDYLSPQLYTSGNEAKNDLHYLWWCGLESIRCCSR